MLHLRVLVADTAELGLCLGEAEGASLPEYIYTAFWKLDFAAADAEGFLLLYAMLSLGSEGVADEVRPESASSRHVLVPVTINDVVRYVGELSMFQWAKEADTQDIGLRLDKVWSS